MPPPPLRFLAFALILFAFCGLAHKKSGPFSSWLKKAAGRLPFSRAAKNKDEVDDLLNSDAFLTKKVQILQKRIEATREETKEAELEAEKQWEEWGPQVCMPPVAPCAENDGLIVLRHLRR